MALRQPLLHDLAVTLAAPTVCLAGADGQVRGTGVQGVLCGDVRVLAQAVVTVGGAEPEPVAHGTDGADAEHAVGLLRDLGDPGPDPTVWLRRDRRVRRDGVDETFALVNRSARDVDTEVELRVAADLAPIETIRAGHPTVLITPDLSAGDVRWSGSGVAVTFTAPGLGARPRRRHRAAALDGARAGAHHHHAAHGFDRHRRRCRRRPGGAASGPPAGARRRPAPGPAAAPRPRRPRRPAAHRVRPPRRPVRRRGRAVVLHPVRPRLAVDGHPAAARRRPAGRGTLRTLARSQGTRTDPHTGEQPGKIMHERRRADTEHGDISLPALYYGTVDATALWICLLRDARRHGLPDAEVRALLPHLHAALGWIRDSGDRDGDRFVEYFDDSGRGLANQGWKDSGDAVRFASGAVADGPVALCEVQGYVHEALLAGAELLDAFDDGDPAPWRAHAAALESQFRERFWVSDDDGAFPALALDGNKTPVDALTSNIGHLLGTGLVSEQESAEIGRRLLEPDMASGYGLRTMSARAGGYSPLSYHCGSVWPHDTAVVVRGLQRSGQADRAAALGAALLDAADGFDARLPELFAGFGADEVTSPVPYPASCRPQAWAAAAAAGLLTVLLGLDVDVPGGVLRLRPPKPSPVGALRVRELAAAGGLLDVDIDRDGRVTLVAAPEGMRVEVA